jgi:hypothetical protein
MAVRRMREIQSQGGVIVSWHTSTASVDLRRCHRVRFEDPMLITPLADDLDIPSDDSFPVTARDISLTGVSFIHEKALASRRVGVSFYLGNGEWESVVTALRWCRFRRDGIYQSGGQFLCPISLEIESRSERAVT